MVWKLLPLSSALLLSLTTRRGKSSLTEGLTASLLNNIYLFYLVKTNTWGSEVRELGHIMNEKGSWRGLPMRILNMNVGINKLLPVLQLWGSSLLPPGGRKEPKDLPHPSPAEAK